MVLLQYGVGSGVGGGAIGVKWEAFRNLNPSELFCTDTFGVDVSRRLLPGSTVIEVDLSHSNNESKLITHRWYVWYFGDQLINFWMDKLQCLALPGEQCLV